MLSVQSDRHFMLIAEHILTISFCTKRVAGARYEEKRASLRQGNARSSMIISLFLGGATRRSLGGGDSLYRRLAAASARATKSAGGGGAIRRDSGWKVS